jgi:hypothetical protein
MKIKILCKYVIIFILGIISTIFFYKYIQKSQKRENKDAMFITFKEKTSFFPNIPFELGITFSMKEFLKEIKTPTKNIQDSFCCKYNFFKDRTALLKIDSTKFVILYLLDRQNPKNIILITKDTIFVVDKLLPLLRKKISKNGDTLIYP